MKSVRKNKNHKATPRPIRNTSSLRDSLLDFQLQIFTRRQQTDSNAQQKSQLSQLSLPRAEVILNQTLQQSSIRGEGMHDYVQTNRKFSHVNIPAKDADVAKMSKKESARSRKKSTMGPVYRNKDYPYFNLTLTFYNMRAPKKLTFPIYLTSLVVRCYTICYLIFVFALGLKDHEFDRWQWIIALVISRLLFMILVFRVSLSVADSIVETILKNVWNRRENNLEELFERVTLRTIAQTTKKALVPPELSFVYLFKQNKMRRYEVYAVINFIYLSIETVVFYPFVIGYCYIVLAKDRDLFAFHIYTVITVAVASGWIFVFTILSLILLIRGWRISREIVPT